MKSYVVGFAFDETLNYILLIEKAKPEWQKGKLNGIGGKIELGEKPSQAMVREFKEETGLDTKECDWQQFVHLKGTWGEIYFYRSVLSNITEARTMEEEIVDVYDLRALINEPLIPNLKWLIPMAKHTHESFEIIEITQ